MALANVRVVTSRVPHALPITTVALRQKHSWSQNDPMPGVDKGFPRDASYAVEPVVEMSTLPNGLRVVSQETYSSIGHVGVFVNSGCRDDKHNVGISHLIRRCLLELSNEGSSGFRLMREAEIRGGSISASTFREHTCFTSSFMRDDADFYAESLLNAVFKPSFLPYELPLVKQPVAADTAVANITPEVAVMEGLNKSIFHQGLGSSLYAPENHPGFSCATMSDFHSEHFRPNNAVLVGLGVSHDDLVEHANTIVPAGGNAAVQRTASKWHSGNSAIYAPNQTFTHAAIGFQGPTLTSKNISASSALQSLLGVGSRTKYGNDHSRIGVATAKAVGAEPHAVSTFTAPYTDAGVLGLYVVANPKVVSKALEVAVGELKAVAHGKVTDEEIMNAKKAALFDAHSRHNSNEQLALFGEHALRGTDPHVALAGLANVTKEDVMKVAQAAVASSPSISSYGLLEDVPSVDDAIAWLH